MRFAGLCLALNRNGGDVIRSAQRCGCDCWRRCDCGRCGGDGAHRGLAVPGIREQLSRWMQTMRVITGLRGFIGQQPAALHLPGCLSVGKQRHLLTRQKICHRIGSRAFQHHSLPSRLAVGAQAVFCQRCQRDLAIIPALRGPLNYGLGQPQRQAVRLQPDGIRESKDLE